MIDEWNGLAVLLADMIENMLGSWTWMLFLIRCSPRIKSQTTTQIKMFTKKILKRQKQHDTIIVRNVSKLIFQGKKCFPWKIHKKLLSSISEEEPWQKKR